MVKSIFTLLLSVFWTAAAWAQSAGTATGTTTNSSGTAGTPEIPVGAAPLVVAGIIGAVMFIRSRRAKSGQ